MPSDVESQIDGPPIVVRIFRFWKFPNLLRQTPGRRGVWRNVRYILDEPGEADFVVIHGHVAEPVAVVCPAGNVWLLVGEPPHDEYEGWTVLPDWISRRYSTDSHVISSRHVLTHPALPWHVDRDYDFLGACAIPAKTRSLSWITSNRSESAGHRRRLEFLDKIKGMADFALFGRGYVPLQDKWDGLAPFRYSIAFENFSSAHYWTEKVADCFLAWTMPIYFGCTGLEKFFPPESFVRIDPDCSDPVGEIERIIRSDVRERNLPAICEARRLVLEKYNFFEFMTSEIERAHAASLAQGALLAKNLEHAPGGIERRKIILRDHTLGRWGTVKDSIRRRLPHRVQKAYFAMKDAIA